MTGVADRPAATPVLARSPGTVLIPTSEVGRFALFTASLAGTQQPAGVNLDIRCSASVTENTNSCLRDLRDGDTWVWLLGDDHVWPPNTLMTLLETMDEHPHIDMLVPLVVKRNPPWHAVLFHETDLTYDDGTPAFKVLAWDEIPSSGVFPVDACGSAGMLVRRRVIDGLDDPWFYSTTDSEGRQVILNEDVTFCVRARRAGFTLYATADATMGHLGIFNVRPINKDGRWGALAEFSTPEDQFRHVYLPVEATNA
jgi:hypothetical protein